eukprot:scaffold230930_cov33-Tisochrysis_lutea.AAC.10
MFKVGMQFAECRRALCKLMAARLVVSLDIAPFSQLFPASSAPSGTAPSGTAPSGTRANFLAARTALEPRPGAAFELCVRHSLAPVHPTSGPSTSIMPPSAG